jgi:hypothetical protein
MLYERGVLATNFPFAELGKLSNLNARANAAEPVADFSQQIRTGRPGFSEATATVIHWKGDDEKYFSEWLRAGGAADADRLYHADWRGQSVAAPG